MSAQWLTHNRGLIFTFNEKEWQIIFFPLKLIYGNLFLYLPYSYANKEEVVNIMSQHITNLCSNAATCWKTSKPHCYFKGMQ
jgi:hypothetical protein